MWGGGGAGPGGSLRYQRGKSGDPNLWTRRAKRAGGKMGVSYRKYTRNTKGTRRAKRAGEFLWGCFIENTKETQRNPGARSAPGNSLGVLLKTQRKTKDKTKNTREKTKENYVNKFFNHYVMEDLPPSTPNI